MKTQNLIIIAIIFGIFCNIGVVMAVGSYPSVDPDMVLYMHFNNDSTKGENYSNSNGDKIADYSNFGNNGTLINGTWNSTGGYLNDGAFEFDRSLGNYINMSTDSSSILSSTNFTVSVWFKINSNTSSLSYTLFNKRLADSDAQFYMRYYDNNTLEASLKENSSDIAYKPFTYNLALDTWYNFVATYKEPTLNVYLNGVFSGTMSSSMPPNISKITGEVSIGRNNYPGSPNSWNGSIDEVIVWNKTLSSIEIAYLYRDYHGCFNPSNVTGLSLDYSLSICPGTYLSTGDSYYGFLRFGGNNLELDCNGSKLIGSNNSNNKGVYLQHRNNITIKNCVITNFSYGINVFNITNLSIINNTVYNTTYSYSSIGIKLQSCFNSTLINNTVSEVDIGLYSSGNNYTYVSNNLFYNLVKNHDSYNTGIIFEFNNSNAFVYNNNISKFGSSGIILRQSKDILVYNNYFDSTPLTTSYSWNLNKQSPDPMAAISILELFYTYIGNTREEPPINNVSNISHISKFACYNVSIYNNTYGNNIQTYIQAQGTNDLFINETWYNSNSFWFKSFQFPIYLVNRTDFYNNNNYNNLTVIVNRTSPTYYIGSLELSNYFTQGYLGLGSTKNASGYMIFKDFLYFYNYNNSLPNITVTVFNHTKFLAYNTNGSICGSSNINSNDGQINITLPAGNSSYILDDYNITENYARSNDPISITSTSLGRNAVSTLSDAITVNVDVDGVNDCASIATIVSNGGYSCSGGRLRITDALIGSGTTVIYTLRIGLGNQDNAFFQTYKFIIGGGGALISILLIVGIFYMWQNGSMPMETMIKCLIIAIVMFFVAGVIVLI